MMGEYQLKINFLPVKGRLPTFLVYRKPRQPGEARPDHSAIGYSLPIDNDRATRQDYWIRFCDSEGYSEYATKFEDNIPLTRRAMFHGLRQAVQESLSDGEYEVPLSGFFEELSFNFTSHEEGREQLKIQPYYLRAKRIFGWLVDFHFRVREGVPFSRRVQQLSLSLDRNFKRNLDSYLDRRDRINSFLSKRRELLDSVCLPGTTKSLSTSRSFIDLSARRLHSKVYVFSGGKDSRSQFSGLRQHGPLAGLEAAPKLLFAFRERDRQAARTLAVALRGATQRERYSFPGFESLFKVPLRVDAAPIILPDLSVESFRTALTRVEADRAVDQNVLPLFVLPDGDENGYMEHKAIFTHAGIPTQVCTLSVINDDYALKWSIANIALQIFCKAGGKPWKVRPTPEETLILGISQSHKVGKERGHTKIEKHFAFSVLTDNSGLFQHISVLGESEDESSYLDELKRNLRRELSQNAAKFSQVVIHTSFRLKRVEMRAIEETVRDVAATEDTECRFAVVKVNHRTRFFGLNTAENSLVPYEGTVVGLGGGEHLIWFEGIFPDKQTVTKAFSGPTHLKFLRVSEDDPIRDESLLQDLANLSGCNWRGFNAKSAPVSVFYCHLVADLVHEFHSRALPLPQVQDLRPWFL